MKFLITNDDGIGAPGIERLERIIRQIGIPVVVAPQQPQSGVGHRVTTGEPIAVRKDGNNSYALDGTPADCARIGLKDICPNADWLIAGINPGANLGSDIYQSGTAAAAREAAILGYPSIAISQYISKGNTVDWDSTAHHAESILKWLLNRQPDPGCFWNINLPHPLTVDQPVAYQLCGLDPNPHKYVYEKNGAVYQYMGSIHERPRDPGRDVAVCFGGNISITLVALT